MTSFNIPIENFYDLWFKIPENERYSGTYVTNSILLKDLKHHIDKWFYDFNINCIPMYHHDHIKILFNSDDELILFKLAWL